MSGTQGQGLSNNVFTMVTDGGPHEPWKWADTTLQQILQAPSDHPLRAKVLDILCRHHTEVQDRERHLLREGGRARADATFATPETLEQVNKAMIEIVAAVHGAGFQDHYGDQGNLTHLVSTLAKDFATSMNIERLWFRERAQKDAA